ncbi:MAG: efflux RND transporter periplasmic adaptor subunit, partial [Phreatobacter sp.]|nr:efflux RND transporter periplasmic adaptor subunit [Phreatobacter sp.]
MRRWIVLLLLIVALGGGAWWLTGPGSLAVADQPAWRTARVDRGDVVAAVNATGAINPISTVVVGSQVSGQVQEILADYNSQVEAGQILARLDPTQVRARLDGARADLANVRAAREVQLAQIEQARSEIVRADAVRQDATAKLAQVEAQLAEAERNYVRQRELGARGAVAQAVIDTARASVEGQRAGRDSARAQIASAEASKNSIEAALRVAQAQTGTIDAQIVQRQAVVRQIEVDLANTEIRSPVKGTVVQRQVELGQSVAASLQAPTLFLVAQDLTSMEIYANVDEADVGRVRSGQPVTFSVNAYPGREFTGEVKLVRLGSQTVQNVVIYTAIISFRNPRMELLPGMTATLRVISDRREGVVRVPNAALRWRPAGTAPAERTQAQAPAANPFAPPGP